VLNGNKKHWETGEKMLKMLDILERACLILCMKLSTFSSLDSKVQMTEVFLSQTMKIEITKKKKNFQKNKNVKIISVPGWHSQKIFSVPTRKKVCGRHAGTL
jgi:hypothetical protein